MRPAVAAMLSVLALAACKRQDMYTQGKSQTWDASDFLPQQSTMQHPVDGTVARDAPNPPAPQPPRITEAMLARGQNRFQIFCTECHSRVGDGNGMIVQRGFPQPPSYHTDELRQTPAQHFYDVLTNGYGVMYSFSSRLSPADRWAVTAYIRALQESQYADLASLPAGDRAALHPVAAQ